MNKIASLVLAVGGVAFTLLVVGSITPGWLVVESDLNFPESDMIFLDVHLYASYGLFYNSVCFKLGSSSKCIGGIALTGSDNYMDLERAELGTELYVSILVLVGAGFFCLMAMALTIDFSRRHCFAKTRLLVVGICWFVTAVLIFVPVGLQAHENAKLEDTLKKAGDSDILFLTYQFKTPWSIAIAGVGAMFAVINSVLMAILYFRYTPSDEPVVGQWYPFQNATVDQTNHPQNVAYPGTVFGQGNQQRNMAKPQFLVLKQGDQTLNSAYPGPMNAQGNHIQNMACPQISDVKNENQTCKLANQPSDTIEGNQLQAMEQSEFPVWGQGDQVINIAYPAPAIGQL